MPLLRFLALPLLVAVLAVGAACGGSGGGDGDTGTSSAVTVPDGAVAVVGDTTITKEAFEGLFAQYEAAYTAQERDFPAVGSPEYEQLRSDVVELLVQRELLEREAATLGITVTDEEVEKRLDELKQQFYEGDDKKYEDELKKFGITDEMARSQLRSSIISQKLYDEVTKDVTVTDEDVRAYYDEHLDEFTTPEVRDLAHILVATEAEAKEIRKELVGGADFATLAKEKSLDKGSGADGGNLGKNSKETYVKEFGEAAWKLETGELSQPVKSEFGWHIIKALGDIEPEKVTPFADVEDSIRDQLLSGKRDKAMGAWIEEIRAKYAPEIGYATGFAPATVGATTTAPTTGG
ncbi:MAG: peptidyl-prolyl cis-trans isomerase [Gaiellales bacterium]